MALHVPNSQYNTTMPIFTATEQSPQLYLRAITLFGKNTATYKFALAASLLELAAAQKTRVSLQELAVPYTISLLKHLQLETRQSNGTSSQFLDALHQHTEPRGVATGAWG
jgi:hypothetical protein